MSKAHDAMYNRKSPYPTKERFIKCLYEAAMYERELFKVEIVDFDTWLVETDATWLEERYYTFLGESSEFMNSLGVHND